MVIKDAQMRPTPLLVFGCTLTMTTTIALGQATARYDGKWTAAFDKAGRPFQADVVIAGLGGTWKLLEPSGRPFHSGCLGVEFPITVQSSTPNELKFSVDGSKVQGCNSPTITLKPTDDKHLDGNFDNGNPLKLAR